jgi:nitrate/TMAO reductase-like tetraheme cytochrome c subunit
MRVKPGWRLWSGIGAVAAAGIVALCFVSARSEFCGSCHSAMGKHYASFRASTHAEAAECLDCHSDPGWVGYYHSKLDGVRNVLAYFLHVGKGQESPPPGPAACQRPGCHADDDLAAGGPAAPTHALHAQSVACVDCHGDVGHRRVSEQPMVRTCDSCHPPRDVPDLGSFPAPPDSHPR